MKNKQLASLLLGNNILYLYQFGVAAAALLFTGCVALQPFPNAARSGETVTLAVGAADGMTVNNTTVEFFPGPDPAAVTPIPVPIRSIARIYPDRTSKAWLSEDVLSIPRRSSHGGWLAIVVVDLPTLPEGAGFMRVSTNSEVSYPRFAATPNGTDLPFTVLPGSGTSNPLNYAVIDGTSEGGDLTKLDALPQVIIKPPVPAEGTATSVSYGAVEMDIALQLSSRDGSPVVDDGIAVVLDDQPQNLINQTQLIWSRSGDNFKVILVSPKGMYSHETRVSIVPRGGPEYPYDINGTPMLNSITYFDLNGALTSGPIPTLSTNP